MKWEHEVEEGHILKEAKPLLLRTSEIKGVKGGLELGLEDVKQTNCPVPHDRMSIVCTQS